MQHKLILVSFISFFTFAFTATGQKLVNSPYSRFNIGSIEPASSFRSLGMGGIGTSMRDNNSVYFSNPASYSSLDTNSFNFDFGVDYSINRISNGVQHYKSDDLNFDHVIMAFPISKGWGFATGIVPVSNGYYKIAETIQQGSPIYDPAIGPYTGYHQGEGGFNKFFIGSGVRINKNFSVGVNMTIIFGEITRTNSFVFNDFYNVFHVSDREKLQLSGTNFEYGIQYTKSLPDEYFLNAGISLQSSKYYGSKYEKLLVGYTAYGTRDTVSYISDNTSSALMPGTLRMGISFGKRNKFVTGIDFVSTSWSGSRIPGIDGTAADTRSILWGAEIVPDKFSNYSFLRRMEYRIGGHIGNNYLIFENGEQVKEYGLSVGLGIPLRRSWSKTNLFYDFTRKSGSPSTNSYTEKFHTMGLSFNFYDYWFVKRRYD